MLYNYNIKKIKMAETTQPEPDYGHFCDIESLTLEQKIIIVRTHNGYNVSQHNLLKQGEYVNPHISYFLCFRDNYASSPLNENKIASGLVYEEKDESSCFQSKREVCNYLCVCVFSALIGFYVAISLPTETGI